MLPYYINLVKFDILWLSKIFKMTYNTKEDLTNQWWYPRLLPDYCTVLYPDTFLIRVDMRQKYLEFAVLLFFIVESFFICPTQMPMSRHATFLLVHRKCQCIRFQKCFGVGKWDHYFTNCDSVVKTNTNLEKKYRNT